MQIIRKLLKTDNYKITVVKVVDYSISIILIFAGIFKIIDPVPLINILESLRFFPESFVLVIAILFPILEILLGLWGFIKKAHKQRITIVATLFLLFFLFSILGFAFRIKADCGCFGSLVTSEFDLKMIIRNIILLMLVSIVFINEIKLGRAN